MHRTSEYDLNWYKEWFKMFLNSDAFFLIYIIWAFTAARILYLFLFLCKQLKESGFYFEKIIMCHEN